MGLSLFYPLFSVVIILLSSLSASPSQQRQHQNAHAKSRGELSLKVEEDDEIIYQMDLMSWVRGHTVQVGNISETEVKAIVNSLKLLTRPEHAKYSRVKVYNYEFDKGGTSRDNAENWAVTREVLVYSDPEENKHWILNIEDLDLRQNLIIFRLGDLGFGFAKEDTYVVLRKSMSHKDPFHYFHLAYILPRKKGRVRSAKDMEVEWDNIRPKDMLPIPLIYKEPEDVHRDHCKPRDCGLPEVIFGTCITVRLSCDDLKNVPIYGREKERVDALIREQQPFVYELARSVSIHQKYMKERQSSSITRKKRSSSNNHGTMAEDVHHHSVKKDIAPSSHKQPTVVLIQKEEIVTDAPSVNRERKEAPSNSTKELEESTQKLVLSQDPVAAADREKKESIAKIKMPNFTTPTQPQPNQNGSNITSPPEQSYFESILEKIRTSPPAKYTIRPRECVGCEPMGTFFSEYQETALTSYVVNNLINDIFKNTSSAVFSPEPQEILREYEKLVPYVGYGPCPYSIYAISQAPKSTEIDDVIDYYAETLAVNCEDRGCEWQLWKARMREMLTSKNHFLEIWPDKTVHLNKTSVLPKSHILSTYEFQQFMVSILFSTYTTEYHLQMLSRSDTEMTYISHKNQSIRMRFQTRLILRVMDEVVKSYPQHLIKGTRYLLQILEDKYLALVAEHGAISTFNFKGGETERSLFKSMNKNDRVQTLALKDFLMNGIASITKSGAGVLSAFNTFYNHNHERISNLLVEFGVDRKRKQGENKGNQRRSVEDYETELLNKVWADGDLYGERKEQRFITSFVESDEGES